MIQFLGASDSAANALAATYDIDLVTVSYLVAVLAAYAGLLLSDRIGVAENRHGRWAWLAAGAVTMGIGVWAMHFIGMLAYVLPVPVLYDPWITLASVVPAILACALALRIMSRARRLQGGTGWRHIVISGVSIGIGIGVMHYTGMAAMRLDAAVVYDPVLFAVSVVVAAALGVAALYIHALKERQWHNDTRWWLYPISAALIGLAVTGMHYPAMGATYCFAVDRPQLGNVAGLDNFWMGVGVTVVTVLIVLLAIAAASVDKRLQAAAELLQVSRQRMVEAVESISDGFIMFDGSGRLVMCNGVFRGMYPELGEVLKPNTPYNKVLESWAKLERTDIDTARTLDYVNDCIKRFADGTIGGDDPEEDRLDDGRWVYIRQHPIKSGGIVGVWADVTPIKELQNLYEERANHDALTNLPNRQLFEDRLDHAARHARRLGSDFALMYVDLDGFKPVNDTHGHAAGDEVLREIARRLESVVRETDTVARVGGDEFAIILEPYGNREQAELVAQRIVRRVAEPFMVGNRQCSVGISIGIAVSSGQDFDRPALIKKADTAMYEAKKASGNSYRFGDA
ncbi:MAG: diguanylate cyclase [Alphaproteobacteria bacterium]